MTDGRAARELEEAAQHYNAGELAEAQALCAQVLARDKRATRALQILGLIASTRRRWEEARTFFQRGLRLQPKSPLFLFLLAKVKTFEGELDEAIAGFDAVLAIDPSFVVAVGWKAAALERRGDHEPARALLEPFIADATEDADMAEVYARLEVRDGRPERALEIIDRQLERTGLDPTSRRLLMFLQGSTLEKTGAHDRAFEAYREANALEGEAFDAAEWIEATDRIVAAFSAERMAALPRAPHDSSRAIFIAGLPRSGTTLVEQIIDAHPEAHGAGEIKTLVDIAAGLPDLIRSQQPYPECVADLSPAAVGNIGRRYLNRVARLDRRARRIVNKSIENYKLLGLVALLLPQARVIHCRRDPLDTCFSCYANFLPATAYPYASDLRGVGIAYRQYERLMEHWRACALELPMLDISYEELVADQERVSREIIAFCGLEWDERCLRFHESNRFAKTLSYDQVRQPVYTSSVRRAERFAPYLGPLQEALAASDADR